MKVGITRKPFINLFIVIFTLTIILFAGCTGRPASVSQSTLPTLATLPTATPLPTESSAIPTDIFIPASIASSAGIGEWLTQTNIDPMDDSVSYALVLIASETIPTWLDRAMPYIRISCFADLGVIVSVNLEGGTFDEWVNYDTTRVRLRFDGGEVISRTPKLNDSRDSAYFWNAESEIVGLFLDHDTALVEVTPFNTSPSAIEFDLHGLREAMQQTAPDCFADFL